MKKFVLIMSVICAVSTALWSVSIHKNTKLPEAKHNEIQTEDDESGEAASVYSAKDSKQYVVKKYNDVIGIFRAGAGKPIRILETFVFTLPFADRIMLSEGICVNEENLYKIVEDYTG